MDREFRNLIASGIFVALAIVLPFLTGQVQQLGQMLLPMHLPVLICGFVCGWKWGLAVGLIAPLLRSALFGMPPMYPIAQAMAVELAVYGVVTGVLYARLPRRPMYLYVALIGAMLLGRVAWAGATYLLTGALTMEIFLAGAFVQAWPGILLQLILVPPIVMALARTGDLPPYRSAK